MTTLEARAGLVFAFLLRAGLAEPAKPPCYKVAPTRAAREALLAVEDAAWKRVAKIKWGPSAYATTFRAQWNEEGLFVVFDATDPRPWFTLSRRDDHLWTQEVVEIFLDPDRSGTHYAEVEINPANAVCDFHILAPLPMKEGDPPWKGDIGWNYEGVETHVVIRERGRRTVGWTASAFLPWSGLSSLPSAANVKWPPRRGDRWRFNVFRVERPHGPADPERDAVYAAWSPAHIPKFHVATVFRDLVFE